METSLPTSIDLNCFIDLACAAWKLRRQVVVQATGEPGEDTNQLAPRVAVLWNSLSELGLQIEDHTGNVVDPELLQSVEFFAWEPKQATLREAVIETVRPTVYLNGKRILKGLVVVAASAKAETA